MQINSLAAHETEFSFFMYLLWDYTSEIYQLTLCHQHYKEDSQHKSCSHYFSPFDWSRLTDRVTAFLFASGALPKITRTADPEYSEKFEELRGDQNFEVKFLNRRG